MPEFIVNLEQGNLGDMGPSSYIQLIETLRTEKIEGYHYEKLETILKNIVNKNIQRNPEEWKNYGYRPSDYITS